MRIECKPFAHYVKIIYNVLVLKYIYSIFNLSNKNSKHIDNN